MIESVFSYKLFLLFYIQIQKYDLNVFNGIIIYMKKSSISFKRSSIASRHTSLILKNDKSIKKRSTMIDLDHELIKAKGSKQNTFEIKRLDDKKIDIFNTNRSVVSLGQNEMTKKDLNVFKENSDIIVANRVTSELKDVYKKVFTRDLFGADQFWEQLHRKLLQ